MRFRAEMAAARQGRRCRRQARETGASCKLSGPVTEAGAHWTTDDLRPVADRFLERFGPERLIRGSDWPGLSAQERAATMGGTAGRAYRLDG